ncbi:helix-turn-helix transcriptional regulator [Paraburkholderia caffeinilytica]|uniref:helix-turn-helix transcriptional regulator n=1 Tax=Paraburkholderia caffeinilytica TaxID=1761016 RepID=UPI0038BBCDF4
MTNTFDGACLRPAQAAAKLGIGTSTLWAKLKRDADFPKPLKLGARTTVFLERDLDVYLSKIAAARQATPSAV